MIENNIKQKLTSFGVTKKDKLVLAVSGGVDSMVLLDIMKNIHPTKNLIVAHVDHGLRKSSQKDRALVEKTARKNGVIFQTTTLDLKNNSEATAREGRYNFLNKILKDEGAKYILTAHHANDQIETLLLKIARGGAPLNIWGMPEETGAIKRPLLDVTREEVESYAQEKKVSFREDETNKKNHYTRNRIRNKVIPELKRINPTLETSLLKNFQLGREMNSYLVQEIDSAHKRIVKKHVLDIKALKKVPPFLQKGVIKKELSQLLKDREITGDNVRAVHGLIDKSGTKKTTLDRFTIVKNYDKIIFDFKEGAKVLPVKITQNRFSFGRFAFTLDEKAKKQGPSDSLMLPTENLPHCEIRTRRPGDKIKLRVGHKKVKDILIDNKVPMHERDGWPIVTLNKEIIWIPFLAKKNILKKAEKLTKIEVEIEKN